MREWRSTRVSCQVRIPKCSRTHPSSSDYTTQAIPSLVAAAITAGCIRPRAGPDAAHATTTPPITSPIGVPLTATCASLAVNSRLVVLWRHLESCVEHLVSGTRARVGPTASAAPSLPRSRRLSLRWVTVGASTLFPYTHTQRGVNRRGGNTCNEQSARE